MTIVLLTPLFEVQGSPSKGIPIECTSFFEARRIAQQMNWKSYEITVKPLVERKIIRSEECTDIAKLLRDQK